MRESIREHISNCNDKCGIFDPSKRSHKVKKNQVGHTMKYKSC